MKKMNLRHNHEYKKEDGMKISEMKPDERPREKLLGKGAKSLDDCELLAIVLRTGSGQRNAIDLARDLLASAGNSLSALSGFSMEMMRKIKGIGPDKAVTVAAAMELGKRFVYERNTARRESIVNAVQIYDIMFPVFKGLSHEECWVIFLNRANYIICKEMLSAGGMTATKDALCYYSIVDTILGKEWLNKEYFRLGTSRLANAILSELEKKTVNYY